MQAIWAGFVSLSEKNFEFNTWSVFCLCKYLKIYRVIAARKELQCFFFKLNLIWSFNASEKSKTRRKRDERDFSFPKLFNWTIFVEKEKFLILFCEVQRSLFASRILFVLDSWDNNRQFNFLTNFSVLI